MITIHDELRHFAPFHTAPYANYATSVAICHINALTILKVVKAEAHLRHVAAPVRRGA
jgi:hypothetical protein